MQGANPCSHYTLIKEIKGMAHLELGTAYDMQKGVVSQMYPMTKAAINDALEKVKNMVAKTGNRYYMLLCREKADYTIFNIGII